MEDEIRKVIIENLFACTEPTELKKRRILEIANEITPFVTKVVKEQMNKDSVICVVEPRYNKELGRYLSLDIVMNEQNYKTGDRVKLKFIKEE